MEYVGGYALYPRRSTTTVWVRCDEFGVTIEGGLIRRRRRTMLAWRDVLGISFGGVDAQRHPSLARIVELVALGGRSAYLGIATPIGMAAFHTERMAVAKFERELGAVLVPAQTMIASRLSPPVAPPPPRPAEAPARYEPA